MGRSWNVETTLALIKDLQRRRCLWDLSCDDFKSQSKKQQALMFLAKKYGTTATAIGRRIDSLKNQFRRQHKIQLSSMWQTADKQAPVWFGYESMLFLRDLYEIRGPHKHTVADNGYDNNSIQNNQDAADIKEYMLYGNNYSENDDVDLEVEPEVFTDENDRVSSTLNFAEQSDVLDGDDSQFTESLNAIPKNILGRDQYTVYGEHIANQLRYSDREKLEIVIAQQKISEVCLNLAMGAFSEYNSNDERHDEVEASQEVQVPKHQPTHTILDSDTNDTDKSITPVAETHTHS